jgi:RimJ/RimL family protein N-acetyltransferase
VDHVALTGRLVRLEPLSMGHVSALASAAAESRDAYGWTWVPDGVPAMEDYVSMAIAGRDGGTMLPFATVRDGRVVGSTRFLLERWAWPDGHPSRPVDGSPDACEIGYTWLAASAQRTGVNTEAKLLMLTFAFETWGVHRVSLRTDARNERSRAAIVRLGAHADGVLRSHEPGADGAVRDTAWFTIVRADWPAVRARLQELVR